MAPHVFGGEPTPGTLAIATADLDGDGRLDVVQTQGEHKTAVQEKVYLGSGLSRETVPPTIAAMEKLAKLETLSRPAKTNVNARRIRARVHDRKSSTMPHDWREVVVEWNVGSGEKTPMRWYGDLP